MLFNSSPITEARKGVGRLTVIRQMDAMDCGPSCLAMIAAYHGKHLSMPVLRERCALSKQGVNALGLCRAAESLGLRSMVIRLDFEHLRKKAPLPCIVHWNQNHFVVVTKIGNKRVHVADPAFGRLTYSHEDFLKGWQATPREGMALLLEPTASFFNRDHDEASPVMALTFLGGYFYKYRSLLFQLAAGLLAGSLLGLISPFLTQALVDFGVDHGDIGFVYTILAAQLVLFANRAAVDFIRGWILLHLGTRINVSIISDFLMKLMNLPLSFFDGKQLGDLLQRIGDHKRIEQFFTSQALGLLFSMVNVLVLGAVLLVYSRTIFAIFFVGSGLSIFWIVLFLRKRRVLDYRQFSRMAENQSNLVELISAMPEIKLNNCARQKRWAWEHIQARLFRVSHQSLALSQYQQAGTMFLNEMKNIFITFVAASEVIHGEITLGMMMAITAIAGQLSGPIVQLLAFIQSAQDAKLSLERLGEIHNRKDEDQAHLTRLTLLPPERDLHLDRVSFAYDAAAAEPVLKAISLVVPYRKTTAIVGSSGSGKTTLLKLLLKFYQPSSGEIRLGATSLALIQSDSWRAKCGVVLQEGALFNDTIAANIAPADHRPDAQKLADAAKVANIDGFIGSLPLGYHTKIGSEGHGLSQGQKQRILIARAVYKDPEFLFFDEATSALDARNERAIMDQLEAFLENRTAVVVAHRLSTVQRADQIVVLEAGRIVETGDHRSLTAKRGFYYQLVKNQLELGR